MRPLALASVGLLVSGAAADAATLVVRAEGIEALTGEVRVAICNASFDEAGCPLGASRAPTGGTERFVFEDMALYTMVKTNTFNGMPLPLIAIRRADGTDEVVRMFGYEEFKRRLS